MKPGQKNSYNSLKSITINGKDYKYYSLLEAEKNGLSRISKLPKSLKVLLENLLRYEDDLTVTKNQIEAIKNWLHKKKSSTEINYENHPKDSFTENNLQKKWSDYQKLQMKIGEKSMASILAASQPQLAENFKVYFTLPNKLMEEQLKLGKPKLLKFLRESLNNFSITIDVTVSETIEKKFAYTPQEKYNKLNEKNPLLKKLKDTFQLDL